MSKAKNAFKLLEGKPHEVERSVALYVQEGWFETGRDWVVGMLQVTLEHSPTPLEEAKAIIMDSGFTEEQQHALCAAFEALMTTDQED